MIKYANNNNEEIKGGKIRIRKEVVKLASEEEKGTFDYEEVSFSDRIKEDHELKK